LRKFEVRKEKEISQKRGDLTAKKKNEYLFFKETTKLYTNQNETSTPVK
jgi:hypothetical protein